MATQRRKAAAEKPVGDSGNDAPRGWETQKTRRPGPPRWLFNGGATQLVASEIALLRLLGRKRRRASLQMLLDRRSARRPTEQSTPDTTQPNQAIDQETF
jgi:hypothetical protein